MALDKLTKVQSVGISSFIQVVGVVTATQGFDGNITGNVTGNITGIITATSDLTFGANSKAKLFENGTQSGVQATNSTSSAHLMTHDGNEDIHVDPSGYIKVEVAGSEKIRVTGIGSVGIGSDDPKAALDVTGDQSAGYQAQFANSSGSNRAKIYVDGNGAAFVSENFNNGFEIASNTARIYANGSERLRINSAGLVGIATAGPSYRLDIGDGATDPANGYQLRVNAAGDYIFALQRQSNASFSIRNNSTGTVHLNTQNSKTLSFGVSSGNASGSIEDDVRIDSNGHLSILDGNLVVADGHGIDFSATGNSSGSMTSELLDDYEEGNFTPIVRGRTTAGTASYGRTAVGKYTKVGRMVDVMVDMVFSGANGSGNIEIAGLPFAAHNGPYVRFAGDVTLLTAGISWSNQIACYINDTNSHFWITNTPTSGNYTFVNINSNTTEILLHCTYMVS